MNFPFMQISSLLPVFLLLGFYLSYRVGVYVQKARTASRHEDKLVEVYREVLSSITENTVKLLTTEEYQAKYAGEQPVLSLSIASKADISRIRGTVSHFLAQRVPEWDAIHKTVVLCLTEAVTNVVKYAPGGELLIFLEGNVPCFHVKDRGKGLDLDKLPTMVFVKGFSTTPSLGAGFAIMMRYMKEIEICTSNAGTTLVLRPEMPRSACFERRGNNAFSCCAKAQTGYGGREDHIWQQRANSFAPRSHSH